MTMQEEKFIAKIRKINSGENYLTLRYLPSSNVYIIRNRGGKGLETLKEKENYEYDPNETRIIFYAGVVEAGDELKIVYQNSGKRSSPSTFYYFGEERLNDVWTKKNKFIGSMFE